MEAHHMNIELSIDCLRGSREIMWLEKIESQVIEQVQYILETRESFFSTKELCQLGLDSLKIIALLARLEDSFNIVYDDEE
jgi:acyl carrier protein